MITDLPEINRTIRKYYQQYAYVHVQMYTHIFAANTHQAKKCIVMVFDSVIKNQSCGLEAKKSK